MFLRIKGGFELGVNLDWTCIVDYNCTIRVGFCGLYIHTILYSRQFSEGYHISTYYNTTICRKLPSNHNRKNGMTLKLWIPRVIWLVLQRRIFVACVGARCQNLFYFYSNTTQKRSLQASSQTGGPISQKNETLRKYSSLHTTFVFLSCSPMKTDV